MCLQTKIYKALLTVCVFLFAISENYSQGKISFGKVTLDELTMTEYQRDTTADAIILADIGRLNGDNLEFTRHMRVKILKKSGMEWGNWVFNTPSKSDFRVAVFNLKDGKIVKESIDSKSIYTEDVINKFEVYKVFAPNIKTGSVIDIMYSHFGAPLEWRFQERIPVVYNELTLDQTDRITFKKTHFGLEPIETISANKWRSQNMPAFKVEPFLSNYSNYITKFEFQLELLNIPGRIYLEYSTTWRKVIENLLEDRDFGDVLKASNFLNKAAEEIKNKKLPINKTIEEVYNYVQNKAKWNGRKSMFATLNFKKNFEESHSCNSAEINLAMIILLNKIGINTLPVVLSTRDNGMLVEYSPTASKLNYVIGYVDHEDTNIFLDGTSEFTVPGILPEFCLNGRGLLVKKDNEQWLNLLRKNQEQKIQFSDITITKDGEAVAKISRDFNSYAFLNWMEELKENNFDLDIQKNKLQRENNEINIKSYEIINKNKNALNAKEFLNVEISNQLIDAGDEFLFNPFVFFEFSDNPFKSENRRNPVDLIYPKELRNTIIVKLPKEFTTKEIPASTKLATPDGSASFTFLTNSTPGKLEFMALLKISKSVFTEAEYLELRQFVSEVIKVIKSPVVLSKN
jgi:hypothetical protein